MRENIKISNESFFVVIIILIGIFLRSCAYLQANSYWCDEVALLFNIKQIGYLATFNPLPMFDQVSPPIFLILSKLMAKLFGYGELSLRFIPYFASVLSLILFYFLCKKVYNNKCSMFAALVMLSLNPAVMVMAQTFKQYDWDLLFGVLALLLILRLKEKSFSNRELLLLGVASSISIYFSFSLLFIIASVLSAFLIKIIQENKPSLLKPFLIFLIPNAISFLFYFYHYFILNIKNDYLYNYWDRQFGYYPLDLSELYLRIMYFLDYNLVSYNFCLLILVLFVVGLIYVFKKKKFEACLLFFPILWTFIAAVLGLYPFADRLILYLLPMFVLIVCMPLEFVSLKNKTLSVLLCSVYIGLFFMSNTCGYYKNILTGKSSFASERFREFYNIIVEKKLKSDETVFINNSSFNLYKFYNTGNKIPSKQVVFADADSKDLGLSRIPKTGNIYFYINDSYLNKKELSLLSKWFNQNCSVIEVSDIATNNRQRITVTKTQIVKCYRSK